MRRFLFVALCCSAVVAAGAPARAQSTNHVLVLSMPEDVARAFLSSRPAAIGLGVFPDSRSSLEFLDEIGVAAPRGLPGSPSPLGGRPGRLVEALSGRRIGVSATQAAIGTTPAEIASAFGGSATTLVDALAADVSVLAVSTADDAVAVSARAPGARIVVLGAGARTPLLIGILGQAGLLDGGVAERPGIVTPYDVAATIADAAGVTPVKGGHVLRTKASSDPFARLDALRARLIRDDRFGLGLTGVTSGLGIAGGALSVLFIVLRRKRVGAAFARAGAMVPAGYVGALFVPSSSWAVRSSVLAAAFVIGLVFPARSTRRFCGIALVASALAIGVLTVVASKTPGGEPALSLWGDPLVSWRFFGLRNHLAAFLAGGFVLGTALLQAPVWVMLPGAVAAGVIVGAPTLGAQFIGVLTLAFGAALELLGAVTRRLRAWQVPVAAVAGAAAAAAALLADAGRQISHGGQAVSSIRAGGARVAWEFFRLRARLNYGEISSLGPKGFVAFVLVTLALAWLFVWAMRSDDVPVFVRAGAAGVAAAGLAALVVEDSGFLTAGIYSLYPALGFAAGYAELHRSGSAPALDEPPRDAGDERNGDDDRRDSE